MGLWKRHGHDACLQVLDVGSGSGYLTAIFAHLVCSLPEPQSTQNGGSRCGEVIGVEHIPELVWLGLENMCKSDFLRTLLNRQQLRLLEVRLPLVSGL